MNKAEASIVYPSTYETASTEQLLKNEDSPAGTAIVYHHAIPKFAEKALDRLYGSIFSTIDQFRIKGQLDDASTYVSKQRGDIKALLLFRREGNVAHVLNQLIALDAKELQRFADTLFASDPSLTAISLTAIQTDMQRIRHPHQCFPFTEDIVATLPPTADAFLCRLGKNTRETVKRFTGKVRRAFPSFRLETYIDSDIEERHVRDLFRLHLARMQVKNKRSYIDEQEFRHILELARRRGMVTVAMIDDQVCGGLVCWRVDRHYFMRMIAHDPRFDELRLGTVCCYLSMRECIERGGAAFHFLFGRVPYKYRFLGTGQVFDRIVIYRSRLDMVRHYGLAGKTALHGLNREFRLWLQNVEQKEGWLSRAAATAVRAWRKVKRFKHRLA